MVTVCFNSGTRSQENVNFDRILTNTFSLIAGCVKPAWAGWKPWPNMLQKTILLFLHQRCKYEVGSWKKKTFLLLFSCVFSNFCGFTSVDWKPSLQVTLSLGAWSYDPRAILEGVLFTALSPSLRPSTPKYKRRTLKILFTDKYLI